MLSKKLTDLRRQHRYTLEEVGNRIGVSKQTLYKYEKGIITNIPSDRIEALAEFYGVTPAYLMGWEEKPISFYRSPGRIIAPSDGIHPKILEIFEEAQRAELCTLRQEDIKDGILHIKGTKTEAADRYIALSRWMVSILEEQSHTLKENCVISPYLFPAIDGQQMSPDHLGKTWKTYKTQHGIKSTLHELRHTLISVSKADMPEELLKLVVGHTAKTDTFGIYGHEVDGDLQRAANIFDSIFDKLLD